MYICSNNYLFEIKPIEQNNTVYIEKKQNEYYILCVPALMPENELIIFIKKNAKTLIKTFNRINTKYNNLDLSLYNQTYRFKYSPTSLSSFKSNNLVHSHILPSNKSNCIKIKNDILLYDIKILIAFWEEQLEIIVETIKLKNYKTKAFHVCHRETVIFFTANLIKQNFDYVQYVVAKALFEYLGLSQSEQELLMVKHVHDWKQSSRIHDFEKDCQKGQYD